MIIVDSECDWNDELVVWFIDFFIADKFGNGKAQED